MKELNRMLKEFIDLLFAMYCMDDQLKADELNLVHVRALISLFCIKRD